MRFLLRTLSLSYVNRHRAKTVLTMIGVVVGVATFVSMRSAQTAMVRGFRQTVDRVAGKAQLQITGQGGVPEEIQEVVRGVAGVRAIAPVIEQVVTPEASRLGSVLVLGVDLLGDREMRDYGFEGEDADIDDPLLFLAQPDSVALSRSFADRAGIHVGDTLGLRISQSTRTVVARGMLRPKGFAEAFGGNLAVTDVYAAQLLFGRGRRFDRIEVRVEDGISLEEERRRLQAALGPGYDVETPERRGAQMENLVANFVAGFNISCVFALGIGTFLIFNAFTVSVNRRRRDIGTLRALGATARQVQMLFLWEAVCLGLLGGALGLLGGAAMTDGALRIMGDTVSALYGVGSSASADVSGVLVLEALALGVGASLVGAWGPSRAAARVKPTEALAKGSHAVRIRPPSWWRIAGGLAFLPACIALSVFHPIEGPRLVMTVLILGVVGMIIVIGPAARLLLAAVSPAVAWLSPVTGRLAADSLQSNPRRTTGTVVAITISLAFVVGSSAHVESSRSAIMQWMDNVVTSDLFVRASAAWKNPDYRYAPEVKDVIAAIPEVKSIECYRYEQVRFRDDEAAVVSIEIDGMLKRTHQEYVEGDEATLRRGLIGGRQCAVSDNFSHKFGLGAGDTVELATPSGPVRLPIAAVIRDFTSDRGSIILDRALFVSLWKDPRVDIFDVNLKPGADPSAVRDEIRARIAGRVPALVSTRAEFGREVNRLVDSFFSLMQITAVMAMLVALIGIATSLVISVVERTREIGILKSLGALGFQIRRSIAFEAVAVAVTGFLLSLPLGLLIGRFLETTVAETFVGWRMPHRYPIEILAQLMIMLPIVSIAAAWLPARQAASIEITEAIGYE